MGGSRKGGGGGGCWLTRREVRLPVLTLTVFRADCANILTFPTFRRHVERIYKKQHEPRQQDIAKQIHAL